MKILAVNGSPNRVGSTAEMIDILVQECESLGAVCDKVHIEDYNVLSCQECYQCTDKRGCSIDDDFMQLKARMMDADGVIIGSPYYSGKPVERIEAFTDRVTLSAFYNKDFHGKYFVGVSTSAVDDANRVAEFCANLGYNISKGGGQVSKVLWESTILDEGLKDLKEDEDIRKNARVVAQKLIRDIQSKKLSLATKIFNFIYPQWLNFRIIKFKRFRSAFVKKTLVYLQDKGFLKNSRGIV